MRHQGFEYKVMARVELTKEDVILLKQEADHHYDGTCQSVAVPGRGAFIWAAFVKLGLDSPASAEWRKESTTESWDSRDIDIARKILEPWTTHVHTGHSDTGTHARRLFAELTLTWDAIQERSAELNASR